MDDILKGLNPMQRQAVLHTEGPLLLLAGAGSGKTRVLTHRIAYMIEKGVRPWNILAITFTNKAAKEMKERVEKTSPAGADVWVATFHSTCVRILRRYAEKLGYTNSFTIFDSADSEKLIKNVLKENNIDEKTFKPKALLSAISSFKNDGISPSELEKKAYDFREEKIAEIYSDYQRALFRNNAFDFDDLIIKTTELFKLFPDVLEAYQNRFKYILIDEYQDTNTAQYNLVSILAAKYKNLCVVGDDDQSIYAFRGANIQNILDFEKDYPEAQVIKLEQNYRSTSNILNAANDVIANNMGRKGKTLWTDKPEGEKITFFRSETDRDEAGFIADNIKRLINRKGCSYNQIAILYRNNSLSRALGEGLVKASVPYVVIRGHSFYESLEIKDMLAYLKFIYNPSSEVDLMRIINVPKRGIGDTTVLKIASLAHESGVSMYDILNDIETVPELKSRSKKLIEFRELVNYLISKSLTTPVSELIDEIFWKTGYLPELQAQDDLTAQNRIENLYELQSKAVDFEEQNPEDPSLAAFLDEISLVSDTDALKTDEGAVSLMTLHASKGLEFPVVFLAGFEDGIFPSAMIDSSADMKELEEERRLLYVGITRAQEKLFITCSGSRMMRGQTAFNPPSRFLREIPLKYIENLSSEKEPQPYGGLGGDRNGFIKTIKNPAAQNTGYRVGSKPRTQAATPSKTDYKPGDKVKQLKYGIGTVLEANRTGGDVLLTIEFKAGTKKLYAGMVKPVK
ncbi:MAG: UvrD-helicase domain-containing protein [Clostridiales bacterium]|nr:UvrD-helicase domain-containing protein [Clostridiales bacterium]